MIFLWNILFQYMYGTFKPLNGPYDVAMFLGCLISTIAVSTIQFSVTSESQQTVATKLIFVIYNAFLYYLILIQGYSVFMYIMCLLPSNTENNLSNLMKGCILFCIYFVVIFSVI